MKEFYTYLHRGSDGRVFYVGCATTNPNKRGTRARLQRAYATSGHAPAWHAAAAGGYAVEILDKYQDKSVAFDHERKLIAELREAGEPLVNICSGGPGMPGAKDSDEVRMKKSVTKVGYLNPMFGKTGAANPNSRKVINKETGDVYDSVSIAADAFGVKLKTLYNWLSGHRKSPLPLEFA